MIRSRRGAEPRKRWKQNRIYIDAVAESRMRPISTGFIAAFTTVAAFAVGAGSTPALANTIAELSFSGATWSDGGTLSGAITYSYNSSGNVAIDKVDITTGAGSKLAGFHYVYSPGASGNTALAPSTDYQNSAAQAYEMYTKDAATQNVTIFLDWTGLGANAALKSSIVGGNYSSEQNQSLIGSPMRTLSSAGTSTGSLVLPVQEPSGGALLGSGLLGLMLVWRRRAA